MLYIHRLVFSQRLKGTLRQVSGTLSLHRLLLSRNMSHRFSLTWHPQIPTSSSQLSRIPSLSLCSLFLYCALETAFRLQSGPSMGLAFVAFCFSEIAFLFCLNIMSGNGCFLYFTLIYRHLQWKDSSYRS